MGVHDACSRFGSRLGRPPVFEYRPISHPNRWRTAAAVPSGFDGWGELHYSYVVFSPDSDLTVGGRAEGVFTLAFVGRDQAAQQGVELCFG